MVVPTNPVASRPPASCSCAASLSVNKAPDDCPSVFLNLVQMIFVTEALGIDFVNVFGARWTRSEPSALRDDLDATNRLVVARRAGQFFLYRLAGKFLCIDPVRIEIFKTFF